MYVYFSPSVSMFLPQSSRTLLVYYIEERLNFNDKDIATMFLLMGLLGIFIQGFVLKLFNDKCGERYVVMIAFVFGALNNVIYATASNKATIYVGIAVGSLVGMSFPTISAIKSNNVVRTFMHVSSVCFIFARTSLLTCTSSNAFHP